MSNIITKKINNNSVYYFLNILNLNNVHEIVNYTENSISYTYVEGQTLETFLSTNPSWQDTYLIGLALINIVADINSHNIIHKDLKPSNIIIDHNNFLTIIDFDASRIYDENINTNKDTVLLGTQPYASPEHYGYAQTTFKSDMFSLGKIIKDLNLGLEFNMIIEKACAIDPNNRYEDYLAMKHDYINVKSFIKSYNSYPPLKPQRFSFLYEKTGYNPTRSKYINIIIILFSIEFLTSPIANEELTFISMFLITVWLLVALIDLPYTTYLWLVKKNQLMKKSFFTSLKSYALLFVLIFVFEFVYRMIMEAF